MKLQKAEDKVGKARQGKARKNEDYGGRYFVLLVSVSRTRDRQNSRSINAWYCIAAANRDVGMALVWRILGVELNCWLDRSLVDHPETNPE